MNQLAAAQRKRLARTGNRLTPQWWAVVALPDGRTYVNCPMYAQPYYGWLWGWVPWDWVRSFLQF